MANAKDEIPWDVIQDHLFAGEKIQAIKVYREASGQGLKESKEFIDELEAKLRVEFPGHFQARKIRAGKNQSTGCAGVVVMAVLILLGALFFFFLRPGG